MTSDTAFAHDRMRDALEKIAAEKRPDGTYNLSREACEQIAKEALMEVDAYHTTRRNLAPERVTFT